MKKLLVLFGLLFILLVRSAYADGGHIPYVPDVKIFEPKQRAMIAWSGEEEIILLSTDLQASAPTKVLEIIPFPSEPQAKEGDVEVFKRAVHLINTKLARMARAQYEGMESLGAKAAAGAPAGEVTFHERIGAHDLSVTHVLDSKGFVEWVNKYLKSGGVDNPVVPPAFKMVIDKYLNEGFSWFVFSVVDLGDQPKTREAIQYKFTTKALFYPLKITSTAKGDTSIELLILTPWLLDKFTGIPQIQVGLEHEPIAISSEELRSLNPDMDTLFRHSENMKLRIWKIKGALSSFDKDLIVEIPGQ